MRAGSFLVVFLVGALPSFALESELARAAERHGLPVSLVEAVVAVESGGDPQALSPRGAAGLMQLMPATAARFGVDDRFDPRQSLDGGCAYLRWLLDHFEGSVALALAGYNAGEAAVDKYAGIPPFAETRAYVRSVLSKLGPPPVTRSSIVAPSSLVSLAQAGAASSIVTGGSR